MTLLWKKTKPNNEKTHPKGCVFCGFMYQCRLQMGVRCRRFIKFYLKYYYYIFLLLNYFLFQVILYFIF